MSHWVYSLWFPVSTPDIFGHYHSGDANTSPYFANNDTRVGNMANYYNHLDWALNLWEMNNIMKPDGITRYLFGYVGREVMYEEGVDRFSRGSIDNPYEVLSVTNARQRFMILAYCAESRSKALGQTPNDQFVDWDLASNMGYDDQHYSHSREFRSHVADEWLFWERVFDDAQFVTP